MDTTQKVARFKELIRASPANTTVCISAAYARHFQRVVPDGRNWIIQDPKKQSIYHLTNPDGSVVAAGVNMHEFGRFETAWGFSAIAPCLLALFEMN